MGQGITTGLLVVVNNANVGVSASNTAISSDTYGTVIGVGQTAQSLASVATVKTATKVVPGAGLVLGTMGGAQNVYNIVDGINNPQKPVYQSDVAGLVSNAATILASYGAVAAIIAVPGAVLGAPAVLIGLTAVAVGAGIYQFVASVNGWTIGDDGSITPTTLTPEQIAQADLLIQTLSHLSSTQLTPTVLDLELINSLRRSYSTAITTRSPLVLDLNGDGVKTTALSDGTYFDFDANGFAEQTGWVGQDDGLLVLDRNNDGIINDGTELFGNNTVLKNGTKAANGFVALSDLDSNGDGKIDASDSAYSQLKVLKDGQLLTLEDVGVQSINTGYGNQSLFDENGNQHLQTGTFTKTDGSTATVDDVWFKIDTANTVDQLAVEISDEIFALPDLQGFGNVHSLRAAMALDTTGRLQTLVEQFAAETDPTARKDIMLHIMYSWAGVENVDPNSRAATRYYGNAIGDARKLETLEAFLGEKYLGTWCWGERDPNPHGKAAPVLLAAFDELTNYMTQQLMAQTHLKSLFEGIGLVWDATSESCNLDTSGVVATLQSDYLADEANGVLLISQFAQSLKTFGDFGTQVIDTLRQQGDSSSEGFPLYLSTIGMNIVIGDSGNNALSAIASVDNGLFGQEGNDYIYGNSGNDTEFGGDGNDALYGGNGNDLLNGGTGYDYLSGGAGNDRLDGGVGDDRLLGDAGDDTYSYGRGSGNDSIQDSLGSNRILLEGLNPEDVTVRTTTSWNDELELRIKDTQETLTIAGDWNDASQIVFANGTIWDKAEALRQTVAKPTEGDDVIVGNRMGNILSGLGGNDTIVGGDSDDIFDGGAGDDLLLGSATVKTDGLTGQLNIQTPQRANGNDTYLFGRGDGYDTIIDTDNGVNIDTLRFKEGIAASDVSFARTNTNDLLLTIKDTGDSVTIRDYFREEGYWNPDARPNEIERIEFSDGTVWTAASIGAVLMAGTDGNDTIVGYRGDDTITGGAGDDVIDARYGNDTILGGDGNDIIRAGLGNDIIDGGKGDICGDDLQDGFADNYLDRERITA